MCLSYLASPRTRRSPLNAILRIVRMCLRHRWRLCAAYACMIGATTAFLMLPKYVGRAVDRIAEVYSGGAPSESAILGIVLVILGLMTIRGVLSFGQNYLGEGAVPGSRLRPAQPLLRSCPAPELRIPRPQPYGQPDVPRHHGRRGHTDGDQHGTGARTVLRLALRRGGYPADRSRLAPWAGQHRVHAGGRTQFSHGAD